MIPVVAGNKTILNIDITDFYPPDIPLHVCICLTVNDNGKVRYIPSFFIDFPGAQIADWLACDSAIVMFFTCRILQKSLRPRSQILSNSFFVILVHRWTVFL